MPQKSDAWGIQARYEDAAGTIQKVSEACISGIRTIMGQPPAPPRSWFEDSVKIICQGESLQLPAPATLMREDGTVESLSEQVPNDLPIGYHRLIPTGRSGSSIRLIVSPGRCHLPEDLRIWGWSAQLYATRTRASWGMGDLADLHRLAAWAQGLGAGLLLINPLHAVHPLVPQEASPYSPSSRRFLNPLYLRIEDLPGATRADHDLRRLTTLGQALNGERRIDRDRVFNLKQEALQLLWSYFEGDADFEAYCVDEGQSLHRYAVF
jgi:4-alpha-glucanotransferase